MGTTALLALAVCCQFGAEPATDGSWNVRDFGAVGDGATDDTAAFQRALDQAGGAGGGIVLVPNGRYSFDGTLEVPVAVTLRGVFAYSPAHAGIRDKDREKPEYGSVLMPRAGAGSDQGEPFILLNTNSVIQGVSIYYPDQKPDAAPPVKYPYAIALRGNNPAVLDVELLNPYQGIDASRNQRHLVRNVHGQPLRIGIFVDGVYDIGRIENVHWNPWWSMHPDLFGWQMEHGEAFVFGRTDWQYVLNTFCFGYNVGYRFVETEDGKCNGNFVGIGADDCHTAVQIDEAAPFGVLITNGEFVSFHGPDPTMVRVASTHTGVVRFSNCAFWGPCHRNAMIEGKGTIGFSDCTFHMWGFAPNEKGEFDHALEEYYAIEALGGSVMIRGCDFHQDKPQIRIGNLVDRAIVTDNLMDGKVRIKSQMKRKDGRKNQVIKNNVGTD